jgi:hypothetical protein
VSHAPPNRERGREGARSGRTVGSALWPCRRHEGAIAFLHSEGAVEVIASPIDVGEVSFVGVRRMQRQTGRRASKHRSGFATAQSNRVDVRFDDALLARAAHPTDHAWISARPTFCVLEPTPVIVNNKLDVALGANDTTNGDPSFGNDPTDTVDPSLNVNVADVT